MGLVDMCETKGMGRESTGPRQFLQVAPLLQPHTCQHPSPTATAFSKGPGNACRD